MRHPYTILLWSSVCMAATSAIQLHAQDKLYPQHFNLHEVTLLDSPFKSAMEKNIDVLLSYDTDRLLTPFVRQAGLAATTDAKSPYYQWEAHHPNFVNWCWNPSFALDGHVGGHYLSALALAYAASHDETERALLLSRVRHMVQVLKDCQDAYDADTTGLRGFIGGIPDNEVWTGLYRGDAAPYKKRGGWVPFYCQHKIYAGLRDAYLYAGDKTALQVYRKLCDWGIAVVKDFDTAGMERDILAREHGGMNEVYADAYALLGDAKYLEAARKYSHQYMIDGMLADGKERFLDSKHANTQVPKYIGFERVTQLAADERYKSAVMNFWDDVVTRRTVCIGGNSISEHFQPADKGARYIDNSEGPESCNTNNMLKLTENLFDDTHAAKYADFYEKATLNHILSTQDPHTGGYVYFTSLRPESYRIYSTPNCAMWCCVGTGMENHSKYGHFIYTHSADNKTLYVNLFIASRLADKHFALTQETSFPYGATSRITMGKSGSYTLALRHPAWAAAGYQVRVNGEAVAADCTVGEASYVNVARKWRKGDVVEVSFPMELTYAPCPNLPDYIAFSYGPVLLAAATTSERQGAENYEALPNEYAGDGRMDHSPACRASFHNLAKAPMLIGSREAVLQRINPLQPDSLRFTIDVAAAGSNWHSLVLQPFYSIHNARYVVYWNQQTAEAWQHNPLYEQERRREQLEALTLDKVAPGEQQSEAGHVMEAAANSGKGSYMGESYRDAQKDGWFQYTLSTGQTATDSLALICRFTTNDNGRKAAISVDGKPLTTVVIPRTAANADSNRFFTQTLAIPASFLRQADGTPKASVSIRFSASEGTLIPGLFYLRLARPEALR